MNSVFSEAEALITAAKAETDGIRFIRAYKAHKAETPLDSPAAYVSVDRAEYDRYGAETGRISVLVYGTDESSAYETGELAQTIAEAFESADSEGVIAETVVGEPQWGSGNGSVFREVKITLKYESQTGGIAPGVKINGNAVLGIKSVSVQESGERFEAREILTGNRWHSEIPGYKISLTVSGAISTDLDDGFSVNVGGFIFTGCELTGSEFRTDSEGGAVTSLRINAEKRVRL